MNVCGLAVSLALSVNVLVLAACSTGGGGSSSVPMSGGGGGGGGGGNPTVAITAPGAATFGGNSPNVATGSTPTFTSASAPPVGTILTFEQSAVNRMNRSVADANVGGGTLQITFQSPGNQPSVILTGKLEIPGISLDVPNFAAGLNGGTAGGPPIGGGLLNVDFGDLTYTLLGSWDYQPLNTTNSFFGYSLGGFQTPTAGVPATGTATYSGTVNPTSLAGSTSPTIGAAGGAVGEVFVTDAAGNVSVTRIAGTATVNVNFSTGAVTGALTNMQYVGNGLQPWNNVALTGSLSGASVSGTTSTGGPPENAGNIGFSSSAAGKFNGALYGPSAQEVGAIWTLYDSAGKAALGGFAAKQ